MARNNRRTVYLYIVSSSKDPDNVECSVPRLVDDEEIYFGPCKKSLRQALKEEFLSGGRQAVEPSHDVYVVGFNGSNGGRVRKLVWAGRVTRFMTFAYAYDDLVGSRYEELRRMRWTPIHLAPVRQEDGSLLGYDFVPNGVHPPPSHIADLTGGYAKVEGKRVMLPSGGFPRDLCFTAENLFFARGRGLEIDPELVSILKAAQPGVSNVSPYAIFGLRKDGSADGKTGSYLTVSDPALVDRFLAWLQGRTGGAPRPRVASEPERGSSPSPSNDCSSRQQVLRSPRCG